jgi:hypothetical protein
MIRSRDIILESKELTCIDITITISRFSKGEGHTMAASEQDEDLSAATAQVSLGGPEEGRRKCSLPAIFG